jgi:hypothetical protein
MDYVVISSKTRYLAVCIECDYVFCDYKGLDLFRDINEPRSFNVAYLKVVRILKELCA